MATGGIDQTDYIKAFMEERPVDFGRAALIVVDMQYATGHRDGALGHIAYRGERRGSQKRDRHLPPTPFASWLFRPLVDRRQPCLSVDAA